MTERNPLPDCLSHLDQMRPKPVLASWVPHLPKDLRGFAKALADAPSNVVDAGLKFSASQAMIRAADYIEATLSAPIAAAQTYAPLKVCRDCKWCRYPERSEAPCFHDVASLPFVDWVTGLVGPSPIYCRSMRGAHFPCGVEARLFEARETADV